MTAVAQPTRVLTHLSASSVKNYLGCPLRFFFEKVLKLPRKANQNLFIGKLIHEGISCYNRAVWKSQTVELPQLREDIDHAFAAMELVDNMQWESEADRSKVQEQVQGIVEAFISDEKSKIPLQPPRPLGVEVLLNDVDLGFDYPFVGILDLVKQGNVITDYKSIARTPSDLDLEARQHELQLTAYELLFEAATWECVTAKELVYLVKTKKPKVIRQTLQPASEEQRSRFRSMVQVMVDGVENERYYPCPGMQCSWCDFRKECSQWKGGVA